MCVHSIFFISVRQPNGKKYNSKHKKCVLSCAVVLFSLCSHFNHSAKWKKVSVLRYWGWLKLQVFFMILFPSRRCSEIRCLCVCVRFFHSHRANQQRKKPLIFVLLRMPLFLRFCCRFLFSFIAPLLLFSSFHCFFERWTHTHTNICACCMLVFYSAVEFPKNINFILYSSLILIEKTNGSAKLFFFNTQESNNLMLKSIRGPKFVPSWTAKINSELVNGSILWSQNRCYGNLCNRSVGLNSNTLLFAWREEPSKKSILVFTSSTTMAIVLPYHFWFRWQISVFCECS